MGTSGLRESGATADARLGEFAPSEETMATLRRRVVGAVSRNCPAWLAEQAEDLVQTVIARLVASLKKTEGERTFSSIYLEKAAYGATIDEIRRRYRRPKEQAGEGTLEFTASDVPDPERQASSTEIGRAILVCLARLIQPRKLAVALYLQGCTVREAAESLRWSLKKTESLVYRGLGDLRKCLRAKGVQP